MSELIGNTINPIYLNGLLGILTKEQTLFNDSKQVAKKMDLEPVLMTNLMELVGKDIT
jgi:hypothetical protein